MHAFIRRAVSSDIPALDEIMQTCSAYRGAYSAILEGYALTAAQVVADEVFVIEDAGLVQGFYSLANIAGCPELHLMFVANEAQGRKIGTTLLAHMRKTAAALGIDEVRIVSHPPAEGFYVRMGAKKVGIKAPSGRVTWERPILSLRTRSVA